MIKTHIEDTDEGCGEESRSSTPKPKPKKRKFYENRDKKFFEMMTYEQNNNKEILNKLIEKLGK